MEREIKLPADIERYRRRVINLVLVAAAGIAAMMVFVEMVTRR